MICTGSTEETKRHFDATSYPNIAPGAHHKYKYDMMSYILEMKKHAMVLEVVWNDCWYAR